MTSHGVSIQRVVTDNPQIHENNNPLGIDLKISRQNSADSIGNRLTQKFSNRYSLQCVSENEDPKKKVRFRIDSISSDLSESADEFNFRETFQNLTYETYIKDSIGDCLGK